MSKYKGKKTDYNFDDWVLVTKYEDGALWFTTCSEPIEGCATESGEKVVGIFSGKAWVKGDVLILGNHKHYHWGDLEERQSFFEFLKSLPQWTETSRFVKD